MLRPLAEGVGLRECGSVTTPQCRSQYPPHDPAGSISPLRREKTDPLSVPVSGIKLGCIGAGISPRLGRRGATPAPTFLPWVTRAQPMRGHLRSARQPPAPASTRPLPGQQAMPSGWRVAADAPPSRVPRALPGRAPEPQAPAGLLSARSGRVDARRQRRRSGQPGVTSALRPVSEGMARAGQSWSSLRSVSVCPCVHLLVTGSPLPVPGTGHARKSGVGGARPPRPSSPKAHPAHRGQPSAAPALHQLCSRQPAAGAPGCAVQPRRRILSRPHPCPCWRAS